MATSILQQLQSRYGSAVDAEVDRWLKVGQDGPFHHMMRYQLGYRDELLRPVATPGGKRFRPFLCLLACQATSGTWEAALPAAAAIELLHNFSLIHDDIEDGDPFRRHRPTVWKVWGEPQAINVGDGMFAVAGRALAGVSASSEVVLDLVRFFGETSLALTEGQYLDMSFERRIDVSPDEYLDMIARKTGALVAFSVWSGGRIGGTAPETGRALRDFGARLGDAFQIQDDILGIWGDPAVTGKEPAMDLVKRKKTLPVLLARQRADSDQCGILDRFYEGENSDIGPVLEVLNATGARVLAEQERDRYQCRAAGSLKSAGLRETERSELESLAGEITGQA